VKQEMLMLIWMMFLKNVSCLAKKFNNETIHDR
jgi:hypothetical protein